MLVIRVTTLYRRTLHRQRKRAGTVSGAEGYSLNHQNHASQIHYTTSTKESVFHVELNKTKRPTTDLRLDFNFLSSLGKFCVPVHIWDSLTQFSVWIEPALINEWSSLMAGYGRNKEQKFTKLDYLNALKWEDPERTTAKIRRRVSELMANEDVACCWSGKS